jgi:hypothetical protein
MMVERERAGITVGSCAHFTFSRSPIIDAEAEQKRALTHTMITGILTTGARGQQRGSDLPSEERGRMSTMDEAQSLIHNPLPEIAIRDPLTKVYECDNIIAKMESALARIREERTAALNYAVKNNINEEGAFRIEEKYRKTRTLDIDKFAKVFPEEFADCCAIERRELERQLTQLGKKIPLGVVDKVVNPVALAAAPGVVLVKETISYGVVRK